MDSPSGPILARLLGFTKPFLGGDSGPPTRSGKLGSDGQHWSYFWVGHRCLLPSHVTPGRGSRNGRRPSDAQSAKRAARRDSASAAVRLGPPSFSRGGSFLSGVPSTVTSDIASVTHPPVLL